MIHDLETYIISRHRVSPAGKFNTAAPLLVIEFLFIAFIPVLTEPQLRVRRDKALQWWLTARHMPAKSKVGRKPIVQQRP